MDHHRFEILPVHREIRIETAIQINFLNIGDEKWHRRCGVVGRMGFSCVRSVDTTGVRFDCHDTRFEESFKVTAKWL